LATLTIHTGRIIDNITRLESYLSRQNVQWTLVTKMLCGYRPILEKVLAAPVIRRLHSIADSRISNLRMIKSLHPDLLTMYIKPPALEQAANVVRYADISLNTSLKTLEILNEEARRQERTHRVIVMIELGELREGINRDNVLEFYERAFSFSHIRVNGIGTNLGCMYGVEPTYDKLIQLSLFKQLIEQKFQQKLDLLSGGSSITLPILPRKKVPRDVNHFRIGETAFLGRALDSGKRFLNLSTAAFDFSGEIIELKTKDSIPDGTLSEASVGQVAEQPAETAADTPTRRAERCILDFGELDVDVHGLKPKDPGIRFVGTTSDMTVYEIAKEKHQYRVGRRLHFEPNYIAIARVMNSRYMTKTVV